MTLDYSRTMWTKRTLLHFLRTQFRGVRVIAVSNREPYIHQFEKNGQSPEDGQSGLKCTRPAGGLTVALDPIMRATGGTWIAHGGGEADRISVDAHHRVAVPPEAPSYTLRRVWLDKETEKRYYCGLSNEGLWPFCHAAFRRPVFRLRDWQCYRKANEVFADAVIEEARGEPAFVFIQDYHFALLPRLLKKRNPNLIVAQFWHIPWPDRETFRIFPWKEELLDGLLGNDLLGFHLRSYCANFLGTVERGLEAMIDADHGDVWRGRRLTRVRPFPISIDFEQHTEEVSGSVVEGHMKRWKARLGDGYRFLGIGVDRADYTKGIPDRLRAVDRLLETHPEYRGKLVFLQVAVPSRTDIGEYRELSREIRNLVREINRRWAREDWRPIRLCNRHLPQAELMALHRLSHLCMVTSLHDGMNLVAKEYVASRTDEDGVLILSHFAGAAREMPSALLINPFSVDEMANALSAALSMPRDERRRRIRALREGVRENNIYKWAGTLLQAVSETLSTPERSARPALAMVSGM